MKTNIPKNKLNCTNKKSRKSKVSSKRIEWRKDSKSGIWKTVQLKSLILIQVPKCSKFKRLRDLGRCLITSLMLSNMRVRKWKDLLDSWPLLVIRSTVRDNSNHRIRPSQGLLCLEMINHLKVHSIHRLFQGQNLTLTSQLNQRDKRWLRRRESILSLYKTLTCSSSTLALSVAKVEAIVTARQARVAQHLDLWQEAVAKRFLSQRKGPIKFFLKLAIIDLAGWRPAMTKYLNVEFL
jgi:hypothetical protein